MQNGQANVAFADRPRSWLRDLGWVFFFQPSLAAATPQEDIRRAWKFYFAQVCLALVTGYALYDLQVALFSKASEGKMVEQFAAMYWPQMLIVCLFAPWISWLIARGLCAVFDLRVPSERLLLLVMASEFAYQGWQLVAVPFMHSHQSLENPLSLVFVAKLANQPADTFGYTFWALCTVSVGWAIALVTRGLGQHAKAPRGLRLCIATCSMGCFALLTLVMSMFF